MLFEMKGTLCIENRVSQKTGKSYKVLMFKPDLEESREPFVISYDHEVIASFVLNLMSYTEGGD